MSGDVALFDGVSAAAVLSPDERYRYRLTRWWGRSSSAATFIMLNPSTADATQDDPTIRRCIGFARSWGLTGLVVVNLYAFRATAPSDMLAAADPVGPDNDSHLSVVLGEAALRGTPVVAAWGAHARPDRVRQVLELAARQDTGLQCLGTTKAGQPRHPLYLRADTQPQPFGQEV